MMTAEDFMQEVRTLPVEERKRLIRLIVDSLAESAPASTVRQRSILEFEGVGAEMWQAIDAQAYVNELRDEWDQYS
jgi:hypothetical protein